MVVITDCQPDPRASCLTYLCSYTLKQICHNQYRNDLYEKLANIKFQRSSISDQDLTSALVVSPVTEPNSIKRVSTTVDENAQSSAEPKGITELADLAEYLKCTDREDVVKELGGEDAYEFCVDCVWSAEHNTAQARHTVDRVYGHITFPKLFWHAIIDCLIVQRQRTLTQSGGMFYTFPTATHTRFEHALGVAYLACHWLDTLALRSGDLSRSRRMWSLRMAVLIAGVCHDIGHGPHSHAFESYAQTIPGFSKWRHERMSIRMFKLMAKSKPVKALMSDFGVTVEDVTRRISGRWHSNQNLNPLLTAEERLEIGSRYLINNPFSGIDADRLDYLVRDQKVAPRVLPREVQTTRIIDHSALGRDGQIVYNIKALDSIVDLFDVRFSMYRNIYRHRCNTVFECMHRDLVRFVDPIYDIKGCLTNFHKYVELNEHLLSPWALESNITKLVGSGNSSYFGENRYKKTVTLIKRLKNRRPYAQLARVTLSDTEADLKLYDTLKSSQALLKYRPEKYKDIRINAKNIHVCRTDLKPISNGCPFDHLEFFASGVDEHAPLPLEDRKFYKGRWSARFIDVYTSKLSEDISKVVIACLHIARKLAESDMVDEWSHDELESYDTDDESSFQADLFTDDSEFDSPSEGSWDSEVISPRLDDHKNLPAVSKPGDISWPEQGELDFEEVTTPKSKSRQRQPPYWNTRFR